VVRHHRDQVATTVSVTIRHYYRALVLDAKPRLGSRTIETEGTTGLDRKATTWFIAVERIVFREDG
jgi:hypothetical protein